MSQKMKTYKFLVAFYISETSVYMFRHGHRCTHHYTNEYPFLLVQISIHKYPFGSTIVGIYMIKSDQTNNAIKLVFIKHTSKFI